MTNEVPYLRIAMVCTQRGWHGGELQACLLAQGLIARGHSVLALTRRNGEMSVRLPAKGVQCLTFSGKGWGPKGVWQIRRALRLFGPDVLVCNDPHAVTAGSIASYGQRIPLRVAVRRAFFPLKSPKLYQRFCDVMICVSQAVKDSCRQAGIADNRLRLVYDGVDPHRVTSGSAEAGRRLISATGDQPVLLTVASLTNPKGHEDLIRALPAIVDRHPNSIAAFAGDGPLRNPLQQQAESLGVSSNVRFLGHCEEIADLLAACDLFVIPSRQEGLCSSAIDAMFARRPIVATSAGGIPELFGKSTGGGFKLVRPGDAQDLTLAILHALAAPENSRTMINATHLRAKSLFTADCMVDQTLNVFYEFLDTNGMHRSVTSLSCTSAA